MCVGGGGGGGRGSRRGGGGVERENVRARVYIGGGWEVLETADGSMWTLNLLQCFLHFSSVLIVGIRIRLLSPRSARSTSW